MSPLATEIYKQLLRRLRGSQTSISYGQLAAAVSETIETHHRSPQFHAALTEVSQACREHELPCLPAVVWNARLHRPSDGYYPVAHPRARTEKSRVAAWEHEHARVVKEAARFPRVLP